MTLEFAGAVERLEASEGTRVSLKFEASMLTTKDRAMRMIFDLEKQQAFPVTTIDFEGIHDASSLFLGEFFRGVSIMNDTQGYSEFPALENVPPNIRENIEFGLWSAHIDVDASKITYQAA